MSTEPEGATILLAPLFDPAYLKEKEDTEILISITPHLVRVVLGGPGLDDIVDNGCTDKYVKFAFPRPGVVYPTPFDVAAIREQRTDLGLRGHWS